MKDIGARKNCLNCLFYKREIENTDDDGWKPCCAWYMDHVVCGDKKNTNTCPNKQFVV